MLSLSKPMFTIKGFLQPALTGLAISLSAIAVLPVPQAIAQFEPTNPGRPGNRDGGGVRGCLFGVPPRLVALMPESNLGYTTRAYPDFYAYVPTNIAPLMSFSLYETDEAGEDRQLVYQVVLPAQQTPGIVRFSLPDDLGIEPLSHEQSYQWSVALICDPDNFESSISTLTWVQRVEPDADLADKIAAADPVDQAQLYAQNGIWFDALDQHLVALDAHPDDDTVQQQWQDFLTSVDLGAIADYGLSNSRPEPDQPEPDPSEPDPSETDPSEPE
ncbi:MAG: DUF928 domain-containing protein [Cyanobacteria bacterium P01_H01_bin.119]